MTNIATTKSANLEIQADQISHYREKLSANWKFKNPEGFEQLFSIIGCKGARLMALLKITVMFWSKLQPNLGERCLGSKGEHLQVLTMNFSLFGSLWKIWVIINDFSCHLPKSQLCKTIQK